MANHKSTKKQILSDRRKAAQNRARINSCKKNIKGFYKDFKSDTELVQGASKDSVYQRVRVCISKIDKLVKRGIIHKNTGSRRKSNLYKKINKIA